MIQIEEHIFQMGWFNHQLELSNHLRSIMVSTHSLPLGIHWGKPNIFPSQEMEHMLFKNYTPGNKRLELQKVVVCRYFSIFQGSIFKGPCLFFWGVTYTTNEHLTWLPQKQTMHIY